MSLRKALAWAFSQQIALFILQLIGSVVIARLLVPAELGIFALAMASSSLIGSLRQFGIGSYLIREAQLDREKIRTAFGMWLVVSWTVSIVLVLIRVPLAEFYGAPGIADVLLVVSFSFLITPFGQPAHALLTREMRFDILHHIAVVSSVVGLATSISLAWLGYSYMGLAWGLLASTLTGAILLMSVRRDLSIKPSFRYWRDVLYFGGYLTGASLTGTANVEGTKFVLGGLISPAAIALYDRAIQIPAVIRQGMFGPFGAVLFPKLAEDVRNDKPIGPVVEKVAGATTMIVLPAFLAIGICSEGIIVFLFGDNWRVAGEILPFILLAHAILAFLPQPDQILTPHGKVKTLFWLRLLGLINNMLLATLGALHSLEMFAWLRPLEALMFVMGTYYCIRSCWGTSLKRLAPLYAKALGVALVSALPAMIVRFEYGVDVPWYALIGAGMSVAGLWAVAIWNLQHPVTSELKMAMSRLGAGKKM